MTAMTPEHAHTLDNAKNAVVPLLVELAAKLRRRVVGCDQPSASCNHGPQLALADLYETCAIVVQAADDVDEIIAAVMTAVNGGEQ